MNDEINEAAAWYKGDGLLTCATSGGPSVFFLAPFVGIGIGLIARTSAADAARRSAARDDPWYRKQHFHRAFRRERPRGSSRAASRARRYLRRLRR